MAPLLGHSRHGVVAMSNCPQDLNPCNSGTLKPLGWAVPGGPQ
jgi:hypothetical protein